MYFGFRDTPDEERGADAVANESVGGALAGASEPEVVGAGGSSLVLVFVFGFDGDGMLVVSLIVLSASLREADEAALSILLLLAPPPPADPMPPVRPLFGDAGVATSGENCVR